MKNVILVALICLSFNIFGKCQVVNGGENDDLLVSLITINDKCPKTVLDLKRVFKEDGLKSHPALVANRGFHNPKHGSFSIFETLEGFSNLHQIAIKAEYLYFGHFTGKDGSNTIVLDQHNSNGKLLVELIAYDFKKKVYNFYELIGSAPSPIWIYRGDSYDALYDNKALKIKGVQSKPSKMRCSACHNSGGPIMKEIDYPHSDWWTEKNLVDFGNAKLSNELYQYIGEFVDGSEFSKSVKNGIKLLSSSNITSSLSIKEQLRPLFCTTEINLKSDEEMFLLESNDVIKISSETFVNPFLVAPYIMSMDKEKYTKSLLGFNSIFPETNNLDAQFGFHAPVKSYVDIAAINKMIEANIIDEEFTIDILSVDYKNPLFSTKRCELLGEIKNKSSWKKDFINSLKKKTDTVSVNLLSNLLIINKLEHKSVAKQYLLNKERSWNSQNGVSQEVLKLDKLRTSVFSDEISKNPRGQILEPGFRIVFPTLN
jgi:hypothetical protein